MIHRSETKVYDPAPRAPRRSAEQRRAELARLRQLAADITAGSVRVESASPRQLRAYGRYLPADVARAFEVRYQRRTHVRFSGRRTFDEFRAATKVRRRRRVTRAG